MIASRNLFLFFILLSGRLLLAQTDTVDFRNDNIQEYIEDNPATRNIKFSELNFKLSKNAFGRMKDFASNPIGLEYKYMYQINKEIGFFLHGALSWEIYGMREYYFYDYDPYDGYEYNFVESLSNNLISLSLGSTYFFKKSIWKFNPYLDIDLKYIYYLPIYNLQNADLSENIDSDVKNKGSAFTYALALGSLIDFNSDSFYGNFSVSFNTGGFLKMYYPYENNNPISEVYDYYKFNSLPISFLTFKFGITWRS